MSKQPPWIRKVSPLFKEDRGKTQGNDSEQHKRYNNHKWREASGKFFRGKKCEHPGCIMLANCSDHIVRVEAGGSMWDRRNWQRLCNKHHARKSQAESKGLVIESVDTEHGKIPKTRAHLPADIVGESYLTKKQ